MLALALAASNASAFAATPCASHIAVRTPSSVNWPQTNHDGGHTSYNPSESILSPSNVNTLQLIGRAGVVRGPLAFVVDNGVLFSQCQGDSVHPNLIAISTRTGATLWTANAPPNGTRASTTMAAGQGLVFVACELSPDWNPYEGVCPYNATSETAT